MDTKQLQDKVQQVFEKAFGRTPLKQRLEDIQGEAIELARFTDHRNLREELGDLLASAMALANELGLSAEDCVERTLEKIEHRIAQYQTLGRKVNVAVYGGAFDPITVGHLSVAKFVLDASRVFDEVWFMPCAKHMYGKNMAPADDRLAMCELACKTDGRLKVFSYEITKGLSGETYQMVKMLMDEPMAKDQYDFSFIIGMDNAATFEKWVNYELLERMARFVVVPRRGYSLEDVMPGKLWFLERPHIYLGHCDNNIPQISSTDVRNSIEIGECIEGSVPPGVAEYIDEHDLYRSTAE